MYLFTARLHHPVGRQPIKILHLLPFLSNDLHSRELSVERGENALLDRPIGLRLQVVESRLLDDAQLAALEDVADDFARLERHVDGSCEDLRDERSGSDVIAMLQRCRGRVEQRIMRDTCWRGEYDWLCNAMIG